MVVGDMNALDQGHRMRGAVLDGDVRSLMAAAAPGDLLIKVGQGTRIGHIIGTCDTMDGFHVVPWDSPGEAREVWGCSIRLVKLNR
jgi:hypothetical protein